jgi:hydrogenase maturation protease
VTLPPTIAVFGLGNVLLGDDAVGPFVVELLRARYELPDGVAVADLGTPGLGLPVYLSEAEAVVLVDAVSATGEPGELRLYRRDDLDRVPPKPRVSPHDPAVQEALWLADLAGSGPRDLLLVGVIPECMTLGAGLSERVRRACEPALEAVLAELMRLGAPVTARRTPHPLNIWWAASSG